MKGDVSAERIPSSCLALDLGVAPVFAGSSPAASAIAGVSLLILRVKILSRRKRGSPLHTYILFLLGAEVVDIVFEVISIVKLCV